MDDIDGKFPDPYAIRPGAIEPDPILPTQFFWRRVFAICFDLVVATVVLQMLAVILFSMTAGRVQANNSFAFFMCDRLQKLPAGITVPESFKPNYAMACTKSLFGLPIGRFVTIGKVTQQGAATMNVGETFFVDVNGRPIDGWSIDWLLVPLFLLFKLGGEAISGRTAGKYITGLRVASASPGTIGIRSAVVRNSPTIANWLLS
ncbi:MAG: RDD family protein, partial [Hyphomicrobiaceae bacterium]